MEKHWNYITAMMTNLGELKADRIHSMLGMFASDYQGSTEKLVTFLNERVQNGSLVRSSTGAYSLSSRDSMSEVNL
jgi:hypothetical protein